jgi:hypothetical protein
MSKSEEIINTLRGMLPADAETISVSVSLYPYSPDHQFYWSITGRNWPNDDTQRATGATALEALEVWAKRPDAKAKKIAELEAQLAILRGNQAEVVLS